MAITVKVKGKRPEDLDRAIQKLKRKMDDDNILKDLRDRRFFKKPSVKKREKMAAARARATKVTAENR